MSFWGGKDIYSVAVSVQALSNKKIDVVAQAIQDSIFSRTDLTTNLLNINTSGFFSNVRRYRSYGKNIYSNGLPKDSYQINDINITTLKAVIEPIENQVIQITYASYKAPDPEFLARAILSAAPYNMHQQTLQVWGTKLNSNSYVYFNSAIFIDNGLKITFTWAGNNTATLNFGVKELKTTPYNSCFMVKYTTQSQGAKYWFYFPDTGLYPLLDPSNSTYISPEYLPIAPIVINKKRTIKNAALNKDVSSLLYMMRIRLDEIDKAIYDNKNNNTADLDDAFISFSADINSQEPSTILYLAKYFENLEINSVTDVVRFNQYVTNFSSGMEDPPYNIVRIQDGEYNVYLQYNYIMVNTTVSTIAKPTSVITVLPVDATLLEYDGTTIQRSYITFSYLSAFQRVTTVTVYGLYHITTIYKDKAVIRYLNDVTDPTYDKGFYLPINYTVSKSLSGKDQSMLYLDSLVLITYAINKQHLAWYQNPDFIGLIQFAFVVYGMYSMMSGIKANSFTDALLAIFKTTIKTYAFGKGIEVLVDILGVKSTLLLAIAALAGYVYLGKDGKLLDILNQDDLLSFVHAIPTTVNNIVKNDFLNTQTELRNAVEEYEKKLDEIKKILEQFETRTIINLYNDAYVDDYNLLETPSEFYYRTKSIKNIGVIALEQFSNYTDTQLKLPNYGEI